MTSSSMDQCRTQGRRVPRLFQNHTLFHAFLPSACDLYKALQITPLRKQTKSLILETSTLATRGRLRVAGRRTD